MDLYNLFTSLRISLCNDNDDNDDNVKNLK